MLRIYDYIDNISTEGGLIGVSRNGWRQEGAILNDAGEWEALTEKIAFEWLATDDDDRAAHARSLNRLARRARRNHDRSRPEYYDLSKAVKVRALTPTETEYRWDIVTGMRIPALDPRHQSPAGPLRLRLDVMRRGLWWGIEPGAALNVGVASTTIKNKYDSTNVNYVTVPSANVTGDAPALMVIDRTAVVTGATTELIGLREGINSLDMNKFEPFLNVADHVVAGHGGTVLSDANLPGGSYLRWGGTTNGTVFMRPTHPVEFNSGTFLLYLIARASVDDLARVQYRHQVGTALITPDINGPWLSEAASGTSWSAFYCGAIQVPAGGIPGGLVSGATVQYGFRANKGGNSGNVDIAGMFVVPTADGVMAVKPATIANDLRIDGTIERAYELSAGGTLASTQVAVEGRYLTLSPAMISRLYFYGLGIRVGNGFLYQPTGTKDVAVSLVPRYQTLRGTG